MRIWWRFLAKMGPRWTQDGPSWQQLAPKMGHDGAKMAILSSVWELLGRSWEHFWSLFLRSLKKWPKCKNEQHSITFGRFFKKCNPPSLLAISFKQCNTPSLFGRFLKKVLRDSILGSLKKSATLFRFWLVFSESVTL